MIMVQKIATYDVGLYDSAMYDTVAFEITLGINLSLINNVFKRILFPNIDIVENIPSMEMGISNPSLSSIIFVPHNRF